METTDYLARIEQAVKMNLVGDVRIIGVIEDDLVAERGDYWERSYYVAWVTDKEAGTHRAHINSEGEGALFHGHYLTTAGKAMSDLLGRAFGPLLAHAHEAKTEERK